MSTWCNRLGAHQVRASTRCISTWCNIDLVARRLGAILTWCNQLGAYQVGALTRCISSWCNIDLVHADLVQYRLGARRLAAISTWCNRLGAYQVGAKKHFFCMNSEFFFANVLHFLPKFYLINEVQFRKRIIFIINEVGRGR